jgi:hypothetical protein
MPRSLAELVNATEPAIALVRDWVSKASNRVELLTCERAAGERALLALQVTTRSPMGAIAYETGGLLVDGGWLRVLGAGCARLPRALDEWNHAALDVREHRLPGACIVGDDVVGGFFALNGDAFAGGAGNVFYLAPDTLEWEDLDLGYSAWVQWACTGDLSKFYENARWSGWEREVAAMSASQGLSIYPFLSTKGPPIAERSRRPVPVEELWGLHAIELRRQLHGGA